VCVSSPLFVINFYFVINAQSNYKGNGCGLNEDTLGGVIKGGISQFIALEISRGNSRENRAIGRHLPWLYNPPSAIQQGYAVYFSFLVRTL